ncbi:unnamed protein product [Brassica oleracea var. botrytis]
MCATPDGATDDTKKTRRPHGALSIIAKRRLRKPKNDKLTIRKGGRSQRRLGVTIDDHHQHHASGTTTSHHLKKRYTPPPSVKLATELERAPIPQWQRQNRAHPYQDTKERAIEPQPSPQQYRPKDLRSRKSEIRSEQRPDSRLHAQPNSRSGLRDRLQNPKRRLLRQCRQNPSHRRSMTKGLTPDTELLSSEGASRKASNTEKQARR